MTAAKIEIAKVVSLSRSAEHAFSKIICDEVMLQRGLGVEGDAHCGQTVKHRSRVARDPSQPNLRQVHLIPSELLAGLKDQGFEIRPGDIGENVLTEGIDLHALPKGTRLSLGEAAEIELTGLRNPCHQLNDFQAGLMRAMLPKDETGQVLLRGGVMAIVIASGRVRIGDEVRAALPSLPHEALQRV